MAHSFSLLRCLALALSKTGRDALVGEQSFDAVMDEVARETLARAGEHLSAPQIRAELQGYATSDSAGYTELVRQTVFPIVGSDADFCMILRNYLAYWPSTIRQALRRPSDPSGRDVPAGMTFDEPAELLRFLPPRLPRLRPGPVAGMEDWELIRYCGVGEGTEVWAGRNAGGETTALKFITNPKASRVLLDNEPIFTRAFDLAEQSGIIPLRAVYPNPKRACMEFGYAPGYDLAGVMFDWKWRWGHPMPDPAASLVRRLAEVVAKAHAKKIVHRNLKPSNVILMPAEGARFAVWVTDFGWGQVAAVLAAHDDTQPGHLSLRGAHTPLYLAPQIAAGEPADVRDDVYAIGLIWYQLLMQDPTAGPDPQTDWTEPLAAHGVSAEHLDLLAACLSSKAKERPADAGTLVRLLTERTAVGASGTAMVAALPAPDSPEARPAPAKAAPAAQKHDPDDPPFTGPTGGSLIFDPKAMGGALGSRKMDSGSESSGPSSAVHAKPPGPVTSTLPANVAFGRLQRTGMVANSIGMVFAQIPAGVFMMGSKDDEPIRGGDDEHPRHRVRITQPFFIGLFPVTQGEFRKLVGRNPSYFNEARNGTLAHPVESVTWHEAELFCAKLSMLPEEVAAGRRYTLPTEAQWEYACRAGTKTAFWCGDKLIPQVANFAASAGKNNKGAGSSTFSVGQLLPNPWGLYDMHGNVEEWCNDWYDDGYYTESPADDPAGPNGGSAKVTRGGCWQSFGTECRCAARTARPPERGSNRIGFRVVMIETKE